MNDHFFQITRFEATRRLTEKSVIIYCLLCHDSPPDILQKRVRVISDSCFKARVTCRYNKHKLPAAMSSFWVNIVRRSFASLQLLEDTFFPVGYPTRFLHAVFLT
jgi:hypothetical protein